MDFTSTKGATAFDSDGLIPRHITTREELNELEFANINQAMLKYLAGESSEKIPALSLDLLFQVHLEMLDQVWKWAGKARTSQTNLGAIPSDIKSQLHLLLENLKIWEQDSTMDIIEIAARLHHQLVKIHPFKNGNGRWARLVMNLYLKKRGLPLILWPETALRSDNPFREEYIHALKEADEGDLKPLVALHRDLLEK